MNAWQAALKIKRALVHRYAVPPEDILVLGKTGKRNLATHGWYAEGADAQVIWEGEYDWPFDLRVDTPGVFQEVATGFALCLTNEKEG